MQAQTKSRVTLVGERWAKLMVPRHMYLLFILIESRRFDRKQETEIAIDSMQLRGTVYPAN